MLLSFYEVEMRTAGGGADLCNGGTPNASHADTSAVNLFDNNTSSYWNNGSPGVDSWFKYDFGASNPVNVGEIWFLPRYSNQCPEDFKCQSSDDNTTWTDQGSWVGQTSWTGSTWKTFVLPAPPATVVKRQQSQIYAVTLARQNVKAFDIGIFALAQSSEPFAFLLDQASSHLFDWIFDITLGSSQPFGFPVERQSAHLYVISVEIACQLPWQQWLECRLIQPLFDTQERSKGAIWSLQSVVAKAVEQPRDDTVSIPAHNRQPFDLLLHNPAATSLISRWDLQAPVSVSWLQPPVIAVDGHTIPLLHASLSLEPDAVTWVAQLTLSPEADGVHPGLNDPLVLTWGEEHFELLVDQKSMLRKPDHIQRVVTAISRTAQHALPRATPITRVWSESIWAKDAVEEVLDESVDWELPNWRLLPDRLQVTHAAPLEVAKKVAAAVGGVVQTRPNGRLLLRRRFPVPIHQWDLATPDHVLSDAEDLLAIHEEGRFGVLINQITVQEEIPDALKPFLWMGIDPSPTGHNQGKSDFAPGETVHLLSLAGPEVQITQVSASTGEFMPTEPALRQASEDVIFYQSNRGILSWPAVRIESVTWLGNDLGSLTLGRDARTLLAATSGVAIARVTFTLMTHGCHPFKIPNTLTGLDSFPVAMSAVGQLVQNRRSLTLRRGDGLRVGPPISSPLLSDHGVLQARGEMELDLGESLQTVRMTLLYRPGLAPGDLVEAHDGMYGSSYRGVVTGVTHEMTYTSTVTHLELIKRA